MSAKGKGSWQQFRGAVEQFHVSDPESEDDGMVDTPSSYLPIYQAIRFGLERLAHVEFLGTSGDTEWRVVPPILAVTHHRDDWIGIVCGARTPRLLASLTDVRAATNEVTEQQNMPDRIRLIAPTFDDLRIIADEKGLRIQKDAAAAILTAIPPVDDLTNRFPKAIPPGTGWAVQLFVPHKLRWETIDFAGFHSSGPSLLRFSLKFQRYYFLFQKEQVFNINVQVGKYVVLRKRRGLVRYRASQEQLVFPRICVPPSLIERALVLCSGLLPVPDQATGNIVYSEVPKNIAFFVGQLLRQEVTVL